MSGEVRLRLHDGTEIEVAEFAIPMQATVICADKKALFDLWDKLTPEALAEVTVLRNDAENQVFHGVSVDGVQTVVNPDGTLTAHFYLSGESESAGGGDTAYVTAAKILLGEEV